LRTALVLALRRLHGVRMIVGSTGRVPRCTVLATGMVTVPVSLFLAAVLAEAGAPVTARVEGSSRRAGVLS